MIRGTVLSLASLTVLVLVSALVLPSPAAGQSNPVPEVMDWTTDPATQTVHFQVRWHNTDTQSASNPVTGAVMSQEFGVYMPDYGSIGQFDVPSLAPDSFFDVVYDVLLADLPPAPREILPGGGPAAPGVLAAADTLPCPTDDHWDGNVDVQWTSSDGTSGQVGVHYGSILLCPGAGASYIHVREVLCQSAVGATWQIVDLCPGFSATLVNEDYTPAPAALPAGWSGWICIKASAAVPVGQFCCPRILFDCDGQPAEIKLCARTCDWATPGPDPVVTVADWTTDPVTGTVHFELHWSNPDPTSDSRPVAGTMSSQQFGVFQSNYRTIGTFDVPPLAPDSFFDIAYDVPLGDLPPSPEVVLPGGGPSSPSGVTGTAQSLCPPDNHWDGNVDVSWVNGTDSAQVNVHYGTLLACPGAGASYIHVPFLNCVDPTGLPADITWQVSGLCPGWNATLVNEDYSPAPAILPPNWSGWICVTADASVTVGTECCPKIVFTCNNQPAEITLCATACDWSQEEPEPVPQVLDWTTDPATGTVHFQVRWHNPDLALNSQPVSGTMSSQPFGVFQSNFGMIGTFNVPSLAPDSFFDIAYDVALADLPPQPQTVLPGGGPAAPGVNGAADNPDCPPDDHWDGNVDVEWIGNGAPAQVNVHYATLMVCPGAGASYIHVPFLGCADSTGVGWQIDNLCPGWDATLVNEDYSAAPAALPAGWSGWICVKADASVPTGTECCPTVTFDCAGVPATIRLCATACDWNPTAPIPVVTIADWTTDPTTGTVRFQLHFSNPDPASDSHPVTGSISSQEFGVFQPDYAMIGTFDVPPLAPDSFFDVFYDVDPADLPPQPQTILPGGGPAAPGVSDAARDGDCSPDDHWDGNVDVVWGIPGAAGAQVNVHYGTLLACPGGGASYIHIPALQCNSQNPITWQITDLCPGFTGTLVNEDLSPAPANLPPNWTGYICVTADASVASGTQCCPKVTFYCDNQPAEITLCTTTCLWSTTGTPPGGLGSNLAVRARTNPILGSTTFNYVVPEAGQAEIEIFDLTGRLVRTLLSAPVPAGAGSVSWDGRGGEGRTLPAGVYLVRLRLAGKSVTQKVQLMR